MELTEAEPQSVKVKAYHLHPVSPNGHDPTMAASVKTGSDNEALMKSDMARLVTMMLDDVFTSPFRINIRSVIAFKKTATPLNTTISKSKKGWNGNNTLYVRTSISLELLDEKREETVVVFNDSDIITNP